MQTIHNVRIERLALDIVVELGGEYPFNVLGMYSGNSDVTHYRDAKSGSMLLNVSFEFFTNVYGFAAERAQQKVQVAWPLAFDLGNEFGTEPTCFAGLHKMGISGTCLNIYGKREDPYGDKGGCRQCPGEDVGQESQGDMEGQGGYKRL